jgi:uncharacterized protein
VTPRHKKAFPKSGGRAGGVLATPLERRYIHAMPRLLHGAILWLLIALAVCGRAWGAPGDPIHLDPPGQREFVLDKAGLIDPATKVKLQRQCDKLLSQRATPIIIVTIPSMEACGGGSMGIEFFARCLFDQWHIGVPRLNGGNWNTGILLVVSLNDRKARIELGAGWGQEKNAAAQQIMDRLIVPHFKQGDYSAGIAAGVTALNAMARGKPLPAMPRPWWHAWLVVGGFGLLIFTMVSLARRGSGGWAWLLWGAVFSLVGYLIYVFLTSRSSGDSGFGGFSGGSFGGGFSGGGGATGSW